MDQKTVRRIGEQELVSAYRAMILGQAAASVASREAAAAGVPEDMAVLVGRSAAWTTIHHLGHPVPDDMIHLVRLSD